MKTLLLLAVVCFALAFTLALPFNEDAVEAENSDLKNLVNDGAHAEETDR